MATILLATSNPGKIVELERLLPAGCRVASLADLDIQLPEETGATFAEIAATKALVAHQVSGLLTVADDSGLEVDALNGDPGIRSARFAGEPPDDERNVEKLLRSLAGLPAERRGARFRCSVAIASAGTIAAQYDGMCEGQIADHPRGANGFGYDPVFLVADGRTMAELSLEEKNRVSHRAAAFRGITPKLIGLLNSPSPAGEMAT